MKQSVCIGAMMIGFCVIAFGQDPDLHSVVFQTGEELTYKVKWGFVRLGTLTVQTKRDSACLTPATFKLIMTVQSNPDLPFIWIREYNESIFDAVELNSQRFTARHRNGDDYYAVRQVHDDSLRTMVYTRTDLNSGEIRRVDTLHGVGNYVEGPSLLFYARTLAQTVGVRSVQTIVEGKMSSTEIRVDGTIEDIRIGAFECPVRTRTVTGFAHWTGGSSAGMSGEFAGWMSDDGASIPIRAEMKILLGSITLELERWTRPEWTPPITQRASTN